MKSKNIFIIMSVLLVIAIILGAFSYVQLRQEKAELLTIKKRISSVKKQIVQTKKDLEELLVQNKFLKESIIESDDKINAHNGQISMLTTQKEKVIYELQNERKQLVSLKEELEVLIEERDKLKVDFKEVASERKVSQKQITELSQAKRRLEKDMKKYMRSSEGVELEKIVVKLSKEPEGSILTINQKHGFAIVDIGADQGIIVGDTLDVYRDDELISKAVVEKVFQDMCSVVPAEGYTDTEFAISDKVNLIQ